MKYFHQVLVSKELGGAGFVALRIANFLRERDQESHVWIPGDGPAVNKAAEMGLTYHRYNAANFFSSSQIKAAIHNWRIGRVLRSYSPGVIHVHSPFYYRALYSGIKVAGLRCAVHIQLEEDKKGLQWAFRDPPDLIITCARFLVDYVRSTLPERYQERQPIVAVPNAVDIEQFRPGEKLAAKHLVGARTGIPLVLMVANLAPHKGQETAIRAAAMLKERGVNAFFWLVGTERGGKQEYTVRLHSLRREFGVINQVRFLGQRADVPELLRAADVFLLPSTSEGLPLSLLEAQATKVPVLAAPTAGIPETVLDGETGFLIPAGDVEGYANRIKNVLDDAYLYRRVTEKAYAKIVREYTWKTYGERIEELYRVLIDANSSDSIAFAQ